MKRAFGLLALSCAFYTQTALAYCPSYTPAQTAGGKKCAIDPVQGQNPSVAAWQDVFSKVHGGAASWGTAGPTIGTLESGCGKPKPKTNVAAHFPCILLKAMAMQESGWQHFCKPDAPAGSVGTPERTIVSFDCGYGVGQITSGMHVGENPSYDRNRIAADPTYNMATGATFLREKWNAVQCVGDADPDTVEHWYSAAWAYNGLAYSNNPNNPNLKAGRGPYNPKTGGAYAYQERVWGWMEYPPTAEHWEKMEPAYPNRGDIGTAGSPQALPDPKCASPTSCTATRTLHTSTCVKDTPVTPTDGGTTPIVPVDAGHTSSSGGDAGSPGVAPGGSDEGCGCVVVGSKRGTTYGATLTALAIAALAGRRMHRRRRS